MLCKQFQVQFDNDVMDGFKLHKENGEVWQFREYYFDVNKPNNDTLPEYSRLNTVANLESQYTKHQVDKTKIAREVQIKIGRPAEHSLKNNQLINCPVTVEDGKRAIRLYGPDAATKKGVTVKGKGMRRLPFRPLSQAQECMFMFRFSFRQWYPFPPQHFERHSVSNCSAGSGS